MDDGKVRATDSELRQFLEDAESRNLREPSERIAVLPDLSPSCRFNERRTVYFALFEAMLLRMDEAERISRFPDLADLFRVYCARRKLESCSCCSCQNRRENDDRDRSLYRTFTDLIHTANSIGSEALFSFLLTSEEAAPTYRAPHSLSTRLLGAILQCFSSHKFHGWGIRTLPELMGELKSLRDSPDPSRRTVLLIQYGFPYLFDQNYFEVRFDQLKEAQVNGILLGNEIDNCILNFGSMRMQMALEILVVLFGNILQLEHILKLLWRTVPFPYISFAEMFTLLEPFYIGEHLHLQEVCNKYRQCNPLFEVPEGTLPRSLKHLSRVQVRTSMSDANSIGDEAIDSLDIPGVLKDYLKLYFN